MTEGEVIIKDKDLVIPGDELGSGNIFCTSSFETSFKDGKTCFSSIMGIGRIQNERKVSVIPSSGVYKPKVDDVVIAVVKDVFPNRWVLDINSPYESTLLTDEVIRNNDRSSGGYGRENPKNFFDIGNILSVKIARVDEVNFSTTIRPWKLSRGWIIHVDPKRVPRVIGKKRSMLNLIKEKTNCKVIVGQNGRIFIKSNLMENHSEKEKFVVMIIKKIIREAQTQGLTNRIENILIEEEKRWKKKVM